MTVVYLILVWIGLSAAVVAGLFAVWRWHAAGCEECGRSEGIRQ